MMEFIEMGEIEINGYDRKYGIRKDVSDEEKILSFFIVSSEGVQVYNLKEVTDEDFYGMDFDVEKDCVICLEEKGNCSGRVAYDIDEMLPFSDVDRDELSKPYPEYVCKDCLSEFASFAQGWIKDRPEHIVRLSI